MFKESYAGVFRKMKLNFEVGMSALQPWVLSEGLAGSGLKKKRQRSGSTAADEQQIFRLQTERSFPSVEGTTQREVDVQICGSRIYICVCIYEEKSVFK